MSDNFQRRDEMLYTPNCLAEPFQSDDIPQDGHFDRAIEVKVVFT